MITASSDPEEVWIAIGMKSPGMSHSGGSRPVCALAVGTRKVCEDYALGIRNGEQSLPPLVSVTEIHICRLGEVPDVYRMSEPMSVVQLR